MQFIWNGSVVGCLNLCYKKHLNAFFAEIQSISPLSSSATCTAAEKVAFGRRINAQKEWNTGVVYADRWIAACCTALGSLRSAGVTDQVFDTGLTMFYF